MAKIKSNKKNSGRRSFLKETSIATAGVFIVPRHVLGGNGYVSPSDKLNIAAIGAGGKGWSDIRNAHNNAKENVVALCDVDKNRAQNAIGKWGKVQYFSDFRRMMEEVKEIDAVTISTPDHTHAVAAMAAMQLGKHVYVQKPLTHNIKEARLLTETARDLKIVSQMGNQGASNPGQQQMIKWFEDDLIGKVSSVHVWTNRPVWPQGIPVPEGKPTRPDQISSEDWENFIGPADYVDYHPLYHPFKWRGWWNFGTGALGDMGCHLIDPPFRVLGLGYPTEVECSVGQTFTRDWTPEYIPEGCPASSHVQLKFPRTSKNDSELTMTWYDGGIKPFHPELIPTEVPIESNGVIMIGDKGTMTCGTYGLNPKLYLPGEEVREMDEQFDGGNKYEKDFPEFGHQILWTDACKAGFGSEEHKQLRSSFDYSGPLTETVLMGNIAIRNYQMGVKNEKGRLEFPGRKKLLWNGETMKITNDDKANEFVTRNYREGWELG